MFNRPNVTPVTSVVMLRHSYTLRFSRVINELYCICQIFNLKIISCSFPAKDKLENIEEVPRGLMGRVFGAVADKGRVLTARLVLPPTQA